MSASAFTVPTTFTAVNKFTGPVQGMMRTVNTFASKSAAAIAKVERGFRGMLSPMKSFNGLLASAGLYIGLYSLVSVLRGVVGVVADFEQAQVDIAAVTHSSIHDNKDLANNARRVALTYGEAAKSILATDLALIKLGYTKADALQATEAIITGSIALKANPEELAKSVGASMSALKMPKGSEQSIVDMYAKAADISALDWGELQTMLPIAQSAAAISGKKLEDILALFAVVRNAQVHVSSGSTAIKNMLIKAGIHGKDYTEMLQSITNSPNQLKKAFKLFGPKTLVSALPLAEAQKMGDIAELTSKIKLDSPGYASEVAAKRLDSITGKFSLLKRTYEEFILSTEDGSGKLSVGLKYLIDTGRAALLIASGSDIARSAVSQMNVAVISTAQSWLFWLDKAWMVIKALIVFKATMIAANGIMLVGRAIMAAYSIAMGISAIMNKANAMSLRGNTIALTTFLFIQRATTASTYALNAAFFTSPIFIFGLAILAVVSAFGLMSSALDGLIPSQHKFNAELAQTLKMKDAMTGTKSTVMATPSAQYQAASTKLDSTLVNMPGTQQYNAKMQQDSLRQVQLADSTLTAKNWERGDSLLSKISDPKALLDLCEKRKQNEEEKRMDVFIHDPGGVVEKVTTSSKSLKPVLKSTFGEQ